MPQLLSFAGVGLLAGVSDYSLMICLRELFSVHAVAAALAGYALGGIISYLLNRMKTFRTDRSHVAAGWRFLTINAVGFTITAAAMTVLVTWLGLNYVLARILTTGAVFVFNFTSHRFWTFAAQGPQRAQGPGDADERAGRA